MQASGSVPDRCPVQIRHDGFTDADLTDTHTASADADLNNTTSLGTFYIDPVSEAADAANGSVTWHYDLNNDARKASLPARARSRNMS